MSASDDCGRPLVRVVAAMIERDGRYLLTQRRSTAVLPLLWEFPGGRVERGETDAAALGLSESVLLPLSEGRLDDETLGDPDALSRDAVAREEGETEGDGEELSLADCDDDGGGELLGDKDALADPDDESEL